MHAEDARAAVDETVHGFEHEAVAAKRHDDLGGVGRRAFVTRGELHEGGLRRLVVRRDKGEARRGAHPPVTLMCRARAGRLWRRSMMKSWPLGLRPIASSMAAKSGALVLDARSGLRRSAASSWPRHM